MDSVPKLCECGCGQKAPLAKRTNRRLGIVKGEPNRFIAGHNQRIAPPMTPEEHRRWWAGNAPEGVEYGYCWCECGQRTNLSPQNDARRGWVAGLPFRFVGDHKPGGGRLPYTVEDRGHTTPCWIWQRKTNNHGYGKAWRGSEQIYAHRLYYEREHGPIPDGLELDHLCVTPPCVRPSHLEPVTHAENSRRAHARKAS
jgi:hypothetical protein